MMVPDRSPQPAKPYGPASIDIWSSKPGPTWIVPSMLPAADCPSALGNRSVGNRRAHARRPKREWEHDPKQDGHDAISMSSRCSHNKDSVVPVPSSSCPRHRRSRLGRVLFHRVPRRPALNPNFNSRYSVGPTRNRMGRAVPSLVWHPQIPGDTPKSMIV
jgi:hypothetical protein